MAFIMSRFDVGDYDAWKQTFDADPAAGSRARRGTGYAVASTTRARYRRDRVQLGG